MFRPQDRAKCAQLYDKYYRGRKFHDALYREEIRRHLSPGQRVLDAGCGHDMPFAREFSATGRVIGIDLTAFDPNPLQGYPFGVQGDLGYLPFPDETFDVLISRSVIEHLEHPGRVFREFSRVLRPSGKLIVITPNKYDYVSLIAALTPYWMHRSLVSKIFRVSEDDVFPTLYRANTPGALRAELTSVGFVEHSLEMIGHYPAYLMFSPVLFRLGVLYERMTALRSFEWLRGSILGVFEKAAVAGRESRPRAVTPIEVG